MSLVRVTEVLGKYQDWSKVNPDALAKGCERGTILHKAFANYCGPGLWYVLPDDMFGYYDSFREWFDLMVKEVIFVERRMDDEVYGYSGQPDLGCILEGDECAAIVDWKSTLSKQRVWEGQMAAYLPLAQKYYPEYEWKRALSVQPKPDGGRAKVTEYTNNLNAFRAFLGALNAHKYFIG